MKLECCEEVSHEELGLAAAPKCGVSNAVLVLVVRAAICGNRGSSQRVGYAMVVASAGESQSLPREFVSPSCVFQARTEPRLINHVSTRHQEVALTDLQVQFSR